MSLCERSGTGAERAEKLRERSGEQESKKTSGAGVEITEMDFNAQRQNCITRRGCLHTVFTHYVTLTG